MRGKIDQLTFFDIETRKEMKKKLVKRTYVKSVVGRFLFNVTFYWFPSPFLPF